MRHASLFTGLGGFDLAAEWMGWENIFQCEIDSYCNKLLKKNFPNTLKHGDIRETDFTIYRGCVEVLSSGFPCQPYSIAGKRLGKYDERHLWPENYRAIREIQPRWIVGENVRGLINWNGGLVFDEVQTDLETAGYEVIPFLLPAAGVNAPHRRDRIWFIAYTSCDGYGLDNLFAKVGLEERKSEEKIGKWEWDRANTRGDGTERIANHSTRHNTSWGKFPSQPSIRRRDYGLSDKLDFVRLKMLGNAVVPQVVYQIFKVIQKYEALPLHT